MSEIATVGGDPALVANSAALDTGALDTSTKHRASGEDVPSVYAAYWQMRSGFFNLPPEPAAASAQPKT